MTEETSRLRPRSCTAASTPRSIRRPARSDGSAGGRASYVARGSRGIPARRGRIGHRLPPTPARGCSAPARRPELQRGLLLADDLWLSRKIDRIDIDPFGARGIVRTTSPARAHTAREISIASCACRSCSTSSPCGTSWGRAARRCLPSARRPAADARNAPGQRTRGSPRLREGRLPRRGGVLGQIETARERAAGHARRIRTGDVSTTRKGMAARRGATCTICRVRERDGRRGGTAAERGAARRGRGRGSSCPPAPYREDVGPRRALRARRLRPRNRRRVDPRHHVHAQGGRGAPHAHPGGAARAGGRISCASSTAPGSPRFTASAPGAARPSVRGWPRSCFRELEDAGAAVLRGEAFERALEAFCADGEPERLRLLATYRAAGLRRLLTCRDAPLRRTWTSSSSSVSGADIASALSQGRGGGAGVRCVRDRDAAPQRLRGTRVVTDGSLPERLVDPRRSRLEAARGLVRVRTQGRERGARGAGRSGSRSPPGAARAVRSRVRGAKRRESVVDFEDLQLAARDLLRDDASVREATQLRFRIVMVDEFQDTNRLQCELIDLVAHLDLTEVFTVGDEFSRSRLPPRGLEVFRERRAQASALLALTRIHARDRRCSRTTSSAMRSATTISRWQHPRSSRMPCSGIPSSCSLPTRRASPARRNTGARRGQTHRRPRARLVDSGEAVRRDRRSVRRGDGCGAGEEALRREGLPTYRATVGLLRPAAGRRPARVPAAPAQPLRRRRARNRAASPFVGVSNDFVPWWRNAQRRPLFTALERTFPSSWTRARRAAPARVSPALRALVCASTRIGLEALCERVVSTTTTSPFWRAGMGLPLVREPPKLGRLARDYESVRGADIEGFVRFVRDQDALGAKELEAVAEEEGGGAVRLLTIHARRGSSSRW